MKLHMIALRSTPLLVAGPIAAIVHFLRAGHYVVALGTAGICCNRDFRRRKFSLVTGILLAAWVIGTLII